MKSPTVLEFTGMAGCFARTLTTGADISGVVVGSAGTINIDGNDTFTATDSTYQTGDVVNGSGGTDVMNLTLAVDNNATTGIATVVGVETINVNSTSFSTLTYTATNVTSSNGTVINVNNTQAGNSGSFTLAGVGSGFTVAAGSAITGTLSVTTTAATAQTLTLAANTATVQSVTLIGSGSADTATVSAVGAVTLDTDGAGGNQVETVTLSGNGAAATYTLGTIGAAGNFTFSGSQSVTLSAISLDVTGKTLTDNTTAGTTTLDLTTVASPTDLSKVGTDVVILTGNTGASLALKVKAGQAVTSAVAHTVGDITFNIDNGDTTYVDGAVNLTLTKAHGTGIGFAVYANSATADNITTLNIINSTVAQPTLEILATATAAVNISGTKAVVLEALSTAKSVNATGLTAALTVNYDGTNDVATVTGGAGNDTFAIATGYSTGALTIDGGAGAGDTVTVAADETLTPITFSNVEVFTLAAGVDATFKASQLSGKTYAIVGTGDNAGETLVIGTTPSSTKQIDTATIDLSGLVIDSNDIASITVLGTDSADSLAVATPLTITGSSIQDLITGNAGADVINGAGGTDIIDGGAGNDTITGGEAADSITGGDGIDTINLTETVSAIDLLYLGTSVALTDNDVVTGFSTTDVIVLDRGDYALNGTAAALGNAIAGATYWEGTAAGLTAATAYDVIVLNSASYANVGAAEDAVAAQSTSATTGFVAFHVTGTTTAFIYYDADIDADGNLTNTDAVMTLTGVADATALGNLLSTANFNLIA